MADRILAALREGKEVCAAFYGHPGVFVDPSHDAVARAGAEGFEARMLPGISAEDCLFADLGVDPAEAGCQAFEATSFLFYRRAWDPAACLVLWQIGVAGDHTLRHREPAPGALAALRDKLLERYPAEHQVAVYEAATSPFLSPRIEWMVLGELADATLSGISTLFIPPYGRPPLDEAVLARMGLSPREV
jgi:uncharacterized protein YabN with tetrapyrrole methylase and pyrophosphatase domain